MNSKPISYYVYPYKQSSRSARSLADALGGKVLRREGSRFVPRPWKKVINWGSTECPWEGHLNRDGQINASCNKLNFFQYAFGPESPGIELPRFPRWTENLSEAQSWGVPVVARTILNGHSGVGIVYKDKDHLDELPAAPLYVEYIPKDAEYRVHLFQRRSSTEGALDGGYDVIDVQRKIARPGVEPLDWKVRSHNNGFIYVRSNSAGESYKQSVPQDVIDQAFKAMNCSGLIFGAVDMVWNQKRNQSYCLEINSAPGLSGATIENYSNAIRKYFSINAQ